jgi:Flp pilus assembly pilin Flp
VEEQEMKSIITRIRSVFRRIHRDEGGGLSLETILIIGAIALPILIFLILVVWPRVQTFFNQGMTDLEQGATDARN